jgi:hypothetical protein
MIHFCNFYQSILINKETIMKNLKHKWDVIGVISDKALQKSLLVLMTTFPLLATTSVSAQEKSADDWQFGAQVYLWGATMKIHTPAGDPVTFNFGTILKNLDIAAMTTFDARKNKFSMLTDVIYMNLSTDRKNDGEFNGVPIPIEGKLTVGMKSWVLNLVGGYNLIDNGKNVFDIAAGARYLDVEVPVTVKLNDNKAKNSKGGSGWDGVIGLKGRHYFPDGYYFNYYADVGTGYSKLTWQSAVNFSYDYKKFTGIVGYRYLKWNFKNDQPALDDLVIHGPYISAKFSF